MALTYTAIAHVTVGSSGSSTIQFNNIPSIYTDLVLKASLRDSRSDAHVSDAKVTFNGNSNSVYSIRALIYASNSVGTAAQNSVGYIAGIYENSDISTASYFSNISLYIPSYTSSSNKALSSDSFSSHDSTNVYGALTAGLWADTSAITSITLTPWVGGTSYKQYSTATLYGIKNL